MELPFSRLRRRKESGGLPGGDLPTETTKENKSSKSNKEEFDDFAKRNKLDPGLTEDLANDIISHNPGVNWKDIAGI